MNEFTGGDAGIAGAVVAAITGIGIALNQLKSYMRSADATSAQDKANKTLFEMLETKLQSQHEEIVNLRAENDSLRKELREVHTELTKMKRKLEECVSQYAAGAKEVRL